jgi:Ca2+-dependent lipid-binding protein
MEPTQQEAILLSDKQENNESKQLDNVSKPKTPGSFQAKVGWHAFSNLPNPGDEQKLETLTEQLGLETLIDMYKPSTKTKPDVDDLAHYLFRGNYGEWYHNTGVLLFTVVFTYLLTKLGCGIMGCLVIGGFLTTYYQSSMRRLRRNVRDDIQRELAINRLETEDETAGWINHFMSRFWLIYEPVLSAQITGTADAILIENTPSFLDSIRLTSFTLGTKAPLIEGIKTITKTEPNIAVRRSYRNVFSFSL